MMRNYKNKTFLTKKGAVTKALEEFIARREQRRIIDLFGKLDWDESFNYKAERSRIWSSKAKSNHYQ